NVRFSRSVAPDKATIIFSFNPFPPCQLQDLWFGELRHSREVVCVEITQDRELCIPDPRRNCVSGPGGQLGLSEAEQELEEVLVSCGRTARQPFELTAHRRQAHLPEMTLEKVNHCIRH